MQLTIGRLTGLSDRAVLGLDCLILALVLPQAIGQPRTVSDTLIAVTVVFLTLCYCTIDLLSKLGWRRVTVPSQGMPGAQEETRIVANQTDRVFQAKLLLLLGIITLVTILPTMVAIGARRDSAPYRYIGDSAIEVEQDANFLLHGVDYYARTFFDTPLAKWWPTGPPNPALYHADKLPGEVILTALVSLPTKAALGWFDVRLLYLAAFFIVLFCAVGLVQGSTARLALLAGLALNPLAIAPLIGGDDDVLVLAEVLIVIIFLRRGWIRPALLMLGLVCATKYTAVLFVPFVLLWLAGQRRNGMRDLAMTPELASDQNDRLHAFGIWMAQVVGWLALPIVVLIGPFLLWNARAYVDSTIGFIAGTVAHSFPIGRPLGYGFATFVLQGGLVRSTEDYFPFGLIQLAVGLPLLVILLRQQWRDNTLARVMAGYATLYFVVSYFARFFHANHLAYGVALFLLAYFLGGCEALAVRKKDYDGARDASPLSASAISATPRVAGQSRSKTGATDGGTHVRLDFLVVLLLAPQVLAPPTGRSEKLTAASALALLVVYAVLAVLDHRPPAIKAPSSAAPLNGRATAISAAEQQSAVAGVGAGSRVVRQPRSARLQTVVLLLLIGLLVIWPSVYGALERHQSLPYQYITDNALQTEAAAQFLLAGKNFYATTYFNTPMVHWYSDPALDQALYHDDQLPLSVLLTVPVKVLAHAVLGWFDVRFLILPLLGLMMWLLWHIGGSWHVRRARLAAIVLGPAFVPAIVYGDTDVVVAVALIGALVALHEGRRGLGGLLVGATLAAKQTAFFLYPLYLAYVWGTAPTGMSAASKARYVWRQARWSLLVPALTTLPFLLWNASAFLAGVAGFLAGTVPHSYPIRGIGAYGFGALILLGKFVASPQSYFPFSVIQLIVVLPLLAILCRALTRWPSVPLLTSAYLVVMGFGYFFSRFLQGGGIGFILLVIAVGSLWPATQSPLPARDPSVRADDQAYSVLSSGGKRLDPVSRV